MITWIVKALLAHLLSDFVLQHKSWIDSRNRIHFRSPWLYLHVLITGLTALLLLGLSYWPTVFFICLTHLLIDGWKSYQKDTVFYFIADQFLHLAVIFGAWYFHFLSADDLRHAWEQLNQPATLTLITAYVFVTQPAAIIIGQLTKQWRDKIVDGNTLGNAGKWIGIMERLVVLTLVLQQQYEAIGLLIAAKGLLRFNEANRPEVKTEYLLIGTLLSMGMAILAGLTALQLL